SSLREPANIGSPEYVSVADLVKTVAQVAGKTVRVKYVAGPVGVQSRNFSNERIYSIGWRARYSLKDGIARTYPWVNEQVRARRAEPGAATGMPAAERRRPHTLIQPEGSTSRSSTRGSFIQRRGART